MDYNNIMYLQWCANSGMGQDKLENINVIGPDPWKHARHYRLHQNIANQLDWIEKLRAS